MYIRCEEKFEEHKEVRANIFVDARDFRLLEIQGVYYCFYQYNKLNAIIIV